MVLWRAMEAGWPALLPVLMSLFVGVAVWKEAFKNADDAFSLLHPVALLLFCLVVFAVAGVAAFVFRLFLLLVLSTLGSAAMMVAYFAPAAAWVNACVETATRANNVLKAVKIDPAAIEAIKPEPATTAHEKPHHS